MVSLTINPDLADLPRRERLFDGEMMLFNGRPEAVALSAHAIKLVREAYAPHDPETAQFKIDVKEFITRTGPLKTKFTNDLRTKELVRDLLASFGCNPETTYFDVPRLRVVPHGGYLSAGVSYAYKAHRDTWYASPGCQINYWMPAFTVVPARAMSFYPEYWTRPLRNSSSVFDYQTWCEVGRTQALQQVGEDTRQHPLPIEPVDTASDLKIAGNPGDLILFSASHLHATHPNDSGLTRFSIDFRTVDIEDIELGRTSPNIDNRSTGTTLGDFINMNTFKPINLSRVAFPKQEVARANAS